MPAGEHLRLLLGEGGGERSKWDGGGRANAALTLLGWGERRGSGGAPERGCAHEPPPLHRSQAICITPTGRGGMYEQNRTGIQFTELPLPPPPPPAPARLAQCRLRSGQEGPADPAAGTASRGVTSPPPPRPNVLYRLCTHPKSQTMLCQPARAARGGWCGAVKTEHRSAAGGAPQRGGGLRAAAALTRAGGAGCGQLGCGGFPTPPCSRRPSHPSLGRGGGPHKEQ